jgi:DNA-binding NarL/FixJ family response regulator
VNDQAEGVSMVDAEDGGVPVLIVDDQKLFAESLARMLSDEPDITVVGVASSAEQAVALSSRLRPRVVLMDYQMPDQDGVTTAAEIKRRDPETMVVMLTGFADDGVLVAAIDVGCSGFLTKDRAAAEVAGAVRAAAAGEALVTPDLLARLLPQLNRTNRPGVDLTERERQVVDLMARGLPNKTIAAELYLSVNTVRNYVQSVLTKLSAHSKLEAVANAVRDGVIDYPSAT